MPNPAAVVVRRTPRGSVHCTTGPPTDASPSVPRDSLAAWLKSIIALNGEGLDFKGAEEPIKLVKHAMHGCGSDMAADRAVLQVALGGDADAKLRVLLGKLKRPQRDRRAVSQEAEVEAMTARLLRDHAVEPAGRAWLDLSTGKVLDARTAAGTTARSARALPQASQPYQCLIKHRALTPCKAGLAKQFSVS